MKGLLVFFVGGGRFFFVLFCNLKPDIATLASLSGRELIFFLSADPLPYCVYTFIFNFQANSMI